MPGSKEPLTLIPFGPFEADLTSQELRRQGVRLRLPRQSFQILKILLDRPGELVTREELRGALWPSDTFVDFEHGLNAAINRLRETLGDDADNPRYIETLPRRGYRFVGPLTNTAPVRVTVTVTEENQGESATKTSRRKLATVGLGLAGACLLATICFYWFKPAARSPSVLHFRQLTADRQLKGVTPCGTRTMMVTDGPRVFFAEPSSSVAQVSSNGGDVVKVPTPFGCFFVLDISPDKTELLGTAMTTDYTSDQPLWSLSIASGLAHRLGDLTGHAGTWSPDGQTIAFATGNNVPGGDDVYVATKDGSSARKLTRVEGQHIGTIRWSPQGNVLRMTVFGKSPSSIWEVSSEGKNLHRLELLSGDDRPLSFQNWTADGRYYLFNVRRADSLVEEIWVLPAKESRLFGQTPQPIRLTTGAMSFWNPTSSPDGKQIFAVGGQFQGELVRYDLRTHTFEPYLYGISAEQLDFSRDGKWVTYVTFAEGILWRSRVDGSERMQLTNPPLAAALPRWSPDGTRIAFSGLLAGGSWKIYVVPAEGGKPKAASESQSDELDATWSPDGNSLVFGGHVQSTQTRISTLDLRTGHVSVLPRSEGMFSPRLSPDGRFIVALDAPGDRKLLLFDQERQSWTELVSNKNPAIGWPQWTSDSKYVYFTDLSSRHTPVFYRIRIADRKNERVATFEVPEGLTGSWSGWVSAAPDGSPLLLHLLSIQEIYALDVDLP